MPRPLNPPTNFRLAYPRTCATCRYLQPAIGETDLENWLCLREGPEDDGTDRAIWFEYSDEGYDYICDGWRSY